MSYNDSISPSAMAGDQNLVPEKPHGADEEDSEVLCSVLITVIDHVMVDPTPLEPEEFQQLDSRGLANRTDEENSGRVQPNAQDTCDIPEEVHQGTVPDKARFQVPVLRIFGPILRRRGPTGEQLPVQEPEQSACLHIHGAFPYMLARPVIAGPDGSIHQSTLQFQTHSSLSSSSEERFYTDWDSVEDVERLLPVLQRNLEETIQTSILQGFGADRTNNDRTNAVRRGRQRRVLRRLTVVVGRGFYGYCPGPPAPFLRVEYYDPSQRWRVKACLEKGLDVPMVFHPDRLQYQATTGSDSQNAVDTAADALRFHCYEAHIPYTMQFFKDWYVMAHDVLSLLCLCSHTHLLFSVIVER